ncbi:MAG: replication-associated recombination protein A [Oscillospiraceae bacterium]|jgi:putative ATPase|nr:replication-associated recombination protein A [Oscillospiraceae bacterium]
MANYRPLADEMRPTTLDDVVGQSHILGENGLLRRIIDSGNIPNMIFYGPSGSGKTTVANIIANASGRVMHKLNATTAGIADIKAIVAELDTLLAPNGVLLYLDEIQYFNKKQQQSLLEFIENGKITLIASTTENPYFYVYNAVLSRSTVFEFKQLTASDVIHSVRRAVRLVEERDNVTAEIEDGTLEHIAGTCGGDVRRAINAVELLFSASKRDGGVVALTLDDAKTASSKSATQYDRDGDTHFDLASALHKSLRGSDPDAALYYLARFLEAGDIITPSRRLIAASAEDVGVADPRALQIALAAVQAAERLGLPEARLPLAEAAIYIATAPKSNSVLAIDAALADVRRGESHTPPRHLQNVHADGEGFQREQGYLYPHDFPNHWARQQYLPDELANRRYYNPGENKNEQAAKRYWDAIRGESED